MLGKEVFNGGKLTPGCGMLGGGGGVGAMNPGGGGAEEGGGIINGIDETGNPDDKLKAPLDAGIIG